MTLIRSGEKKTIRFNVTCFCDVTLRSFVDICYVFGRQLLPSLSGWKETGIAISRSLRNAGT